MVGNAAPIVVAVRERPVVGARDRVANNVFSPIAEDNRWGTEVPRVPLHAVVRRAPVVLELTRVVRGGVITLVARFRLGGRKRRWENLPTVAPPVGRGRSGAAEAS